jgi:hypothetical protein
MADVDLHLLWAATAIDAEPATSNVARMKPVSVLPNVRIKRCRGTLLTQHFNAELSIDLVRERNFVGSS